jgi:alkylhydroperoxidase/carboxymuconolactone decarboxylase family protein YurZ
MTTPDTLAARLESLRAKRGYLLPHHGLMALTAPGLLQAYDAAYTALALDDRVLSHHDREFVWLAILIATDEAIATHHIEKFRNAGGSDAAVAAALRITATVEGFGAYGFVRDHWAAHLPGLDLEAEWRATLEAAGAGTAPRLVHMAACAVQTCRGDWAGLAWQIRAAYAAAVPEAELAEAISLTMFPGSVPHFVEAAKVWRELIAAGAVPASDAFRAWAALSGQDGHGR